MKILLNLLERFGRKRIILDRIHQEPYLTRYYLFLKDRKWFPFNFFLHNFHKGDPDDLHDLDGIDDIDGVDGLDDLDDHHDQADLDDLDGDLGHLGQMT